MEAVWGRMEVVGKCSVDEGCGLRAIPLCTAMTGRWCCVKLLRRGEESCGEGLLKGDLSISVFTLGEMPPSMSSVQLRLLLVGELEEV